MEMTPICRTHDVAARAEATRPVVTPVGAASANPASCASVHRSDL